MPQPSLAERVEILEETVEAHEGLPSRVAGVESQIVLLRDELRGEASAIREEMASLGETLRGEMRDLAETLRGEMRDLGGTLRGEMREQGETLRAELRAEIRAGDEETRRYMHGLHEDLVSRIALLGEARRPRKKRR